MRIKIHSLFSSTTNASVSFESWQHVCFTIDTRTNLWNFYKDGLLSDIAFSNVPKFSADALDTGDNKVFIGRNPKEASTKNVLDVFFRNALENGRSVNKRLLHLLFGVF